MITTRIYYPPPADTNSCKDRFVWFGSSGAILKGLDILLDVFSSMPEATLYICGLYGSDRWLLDGYEQCSNIVDCGFVDVASDRYLELLAKASWVILPSASEGMATSVLTCMRHGLIPIVTDAAGVDVGDLGIRLKDYKVDYIRSVIEQARTLTDKEIEERRQKTYDVANRLYSIERFAEDFRRIMKRVAG